MVSTRVVKAVDWNSVEWAYVPAPGEVYVIVRQETDNKYLKIGDGVRSLDALPYISTDTLEAYMAEQCTGKTCAQCEHLCVINRNKVYAVCDETGKVFELWHMDTRKSDACDRFKSKEQTKITTLRCPCCNKPLSLKAGNAAFTYWDCKRCERSFAYDVWAEQFI